MADTSPPEQPLINWIASPHYRVIHSNYFRYRINMGEVMIHFDTITDTIPPPGGTSSIIVGEVSVAMSWPQMKALVRTMELVIGTVEKEIGPVIIPEPAEETLKGAIDHIRTTLATVYSRKPSA